MSKLVTCPGCNGKGRWWFGKKCCGCVGVGKVTPKQAEEIKDEMYAEERQLDYARNGY